MITLDNAQVYDVEVFPNLFTLTAEHLWSDTVSVWEISDYRDDRRELIQWFNWLNATHTPMIGYNSEGYDYPMIHHLLHNPRCTNADLYAKSKSIITSANRFGHTIWPRDRFAPQIDLMKVHHFDSMAKRQSLKGLQFNMRSPNVRESKLDFDAPVAQPDVDGEVIPYNKWDVQETKRFARYSQGALEFRVSLVPQFGVECLSWNDTKIGEEMLIARLGKDVCFDWSTGRKQKRQTVRDRIPVSDILFPYIQFQTPEFQRVHEFFKTRVLTAADMEKDETKQHESPLKIKQEFAGLMFGFGSGGVHASVDRQVFTASDDWIIRDIDVKGMYPAISNVNRLAPEHLGEPFVQEYASLPQEREQYAKGTRENARLKLAGNAAWGKSKSKYSCFYDPKYALSIPVNGQMMICMLVEWLRAAVPRIHLIQANTDGVTYMVHKDDLDSCKAVEKQWQDYTLLVLDDAHYEKMCIANVSDYVAVYERKPGSNQPPKIKLKGAYWAPDMGDRWADSVTANGSWHKDLSFPIIQRAAVAAMVDGIDPEMYIRCCFDPYEFMGRAKVNRPDTLLLGGVEQQRTMRYYVARDGAELVKVSPPVAGGVLGAYKRANGVTKAEYERVMAETGGQWDERVCTANKSVYSERRTTYHAGWGIAECNVASDFRWDNVAYDWYVAEARKLIIA